MGKLLTIESITVSEGRGSKKIIHDLESDLRGEITLSQLLEFTKETLIVTADQVLKEAQSNGFDSDPVMLIDGRRNKNPYTVDPLGQIEYVSRKDFGDILVDAYKGLLLRSKVLKGTYITSHLVFWNGVQIAASLRELEVWLAFSQEKFKDGDTFRIVNIQPYARRLELLGVTAQRSNAKKQVRNKTKRNESQPNIKIISVPNGAYQLTARAIKGKYKNNVSTRFSFLSGSSLGLSATFKNGRSGSKKSGRKNSAGRPYLYPSIIFKIDEKGITNV